MATMTDPAAWFRAQLDADEQVARECERWAPSPWVGSFKQVTSEPAAGETRSIASTNAAQVSHHIEHWEPARALRQVQAHRAILDDYDRAMECRRQHPDDVASAADLLSLVRTIKRLTAIYSDRGGYSPEWSA